MFEHRIYSLPIHDQGDDWLKYANSVINNHASKENAPPFPSLEELQQIRRIFAACAEVDFSYQLLVKIGDTKTHLQLDDERPDAPPLHLTDYVLLLIQSLHSEFPQLKKLFLPLVQIEQTLATIQTKQISDTPQAVVHINKIVIDTLGLTRQDQHTFFIEASVILHDFFAVIRELNTYYAEKLQAPRDETLASILHSVAATLSIAHTSLTITDHEKSTKGHQLFITSLIHLLSAMQLIESYCQTKPDSVETVSMLLNNYVHLSTIESTEFPDFSNQIPPIEKLNIILIIQEALQNALKYGRLENSQSSLLAQDSQRVALSWYQDPAADAIVIEVSNQGPAVDVDNQDALFLAGYRGLATQAQVEGDGYGLFMIQKNINAMGGHVRFISPIPGYQTTLQLRFPQQLFTI